MTTLMAARRLATMLERIEVINITRPDWDTAEGEAFIRAVMDAEAQGYDINELGRALGVTDLKYVVRGRERFL